MSLKSLVKIHSFSLPAHSKAQTELTFDVSLDIFLDIHAYSDFLKSFLDMEEASLSHFLHAFVFIDWHSADLLISIAGLHTPRSTCHDLWPGEVLAY